MVKMANFLLEIAYMWNVCIFVLIILCMCIFKNLNGFS